LIDPAQIVLSVTDFGILAAPAACRKLILDDPAELRGDMVVPAAVGLPDLTGQVAVVTGAARGQGRAHCLALAEAGADIAALDICRDLDVPRYPLGTRAELEAVVADVAARGRRALPLVADVREPTEVGDAIAATVAAFGRIDILVNNAAVVTSAPFWELSEQEWGAVLDINLSGVWRTTRAAVAHLRRSPRGRIVHISSTGGQRAVPDFAHYVAAKHGVVGLTRAMAIELAPDRVTVNAILPGAVDSPMLAGLAGELGLTPDDVHKRWLHDQLLLELITPAEVTGALLWLLSDAARHVTGHCVAVDGGALAR
jgi:SDR family mycofactocin-dependent oxidoreductase